MNKSKIGALLIAIVISVNSTPAFSVDNTYASRDEAEAREERERLERERLELENDNHDVSKKIIEIKEEMEAVETEINNLETRIIVAENNVKEKEESIKEKEEEIIRMQDVTDNRIRSYYKVNIGAQYLYILLKSDGISELISNIYGIAKIMDFDKQLISRAKEIQSEIAMEKKELQKNLELAKADKIVIEEKKNELQKKNDEFLVQKEKIDNSLAYNSKDIMIVDQELEQLGLLNNPSNGGNNDSNEGSTDENNGGESSEGTGGGSTEGGNNEGDGNTGGSTGGGNTGGGSSGDSGQPSVSGFLRPGYGPVTDPYGPRINPVTGEAGMHNGVDFGDPYGANILASKSGTVIFSGVMSGYGNTIVIDHGGGVSTLYAHASSLLVGVGQTVSQGQVVALVGSTGMSTGPHIHFEIMINGSRVDPLDYL